VIAFRAVSVVFGGTRALDGVDATIEGGELCVFVGPSGSGKSTLLRLVNRLVEPSAGSVRVRGEDVADVEPARLRRSIGYAIQSVGLFPHRTVADNVATVPRLLGWKRPRIDARLEEMLALVRLDPALARRFPRELSGGQAQRVGLARALAADPDILLMDEPFGAVDPITRRELRAELRRIHGQTGKTILLVTHDPAEALELATRIIVLQAGRVVADGAPLELTAPGLDPFVRALIIGRDLGLRRLELVAVADAMRAAPPPPGAPEIAPTASLQEALSRMVEARSAILAVCGPTGATAGSVTLHDIVERHP